jgi:uncharacterized membrane protein
MKAIVPYLNLFSDLIAVVGGVVILIGVLTAIYRLFRVEVAVLRKIDAEYDRQSLRHHFGYYILIGLEFLIAADILRTLIHPGMEELMTLGVVVILRTIISITLNWELSRSEMVKGDHP